MTRTKISSSTVTTLLRDLDVATGQLGDVHQTLDAVVDADERAERNQLGDPARDDLADGVGPGEVTPRIFLGGLERQRNALAVHVDVENLDGDLLADLDHLGRVIDVLPGQLGDVDQTVDAAEIDERTEVDDRGHDALADLALGELVEELAAHLGLGLLQPLTAGQHDVVAVLVELDDLRVELTADVRLQVADATHLDQRRRQEATEADVQDEAALDDLDDGAGDDAPSSSLTFSIVPHARSYCARFLDRISRPSLSSFWRTRASTCSPMETTSLGSTSCLMLSSREGMTPSVL